MHGYAGCFFFSSRRRHTRWTGDWSSDVCSSDLNRPKAGRILVDGRDLATLRLADYRRQLGVVLQDNFLFDGTIAENIAFARPHATREDVEQAARIAHCDEFVRRFEKGYDTVVGERGVKLSGGERQRVSIARAILADPRILILDEATSSLDSESEAASQDGLRTLRRGRTTFVIAHRLSTIRSADQILTASSRCGWRPTARSMRKTSSPISSARTRCRATIPQPSARSSYS